MISKNNFSFRALQLFAQFTTPAW